MRLWHIDLIPYLPNSQLIAQWRELNLIFRKQPKHILINYIYEHPKDFLYSYACTIYKEMMNRGYKISDKSLLNFYKYFSHGDEGPVLGTGYQYPEHNNEYLAICYFNLYEKYIRGQKDFTALVYNKLMHFYHDKEVPTV